MKKIATISTLVILLGLSHVSAQELPVSGFDPSAAIQKIDTLILEAHIAKDTAPNPTTDDSTFIRRTYLSVIGRIPTLHETLTFLNSNAPDKRDRLIEELLASEGYVSHQFNFWADLLRVQTQMQNVPGEYYVEWIKQSLRENKPYDEFVRELITADGYVWDNGAAGFYLRDPGMPLDHMANTTQVFLGTQLTCAQCHDHPYDSWTQSEFYEQAAFTFGVNTRDPAVNRQLRSLNSRENPDDISPQLRTVLNNLTRPLRFRVNEQTGKLRLPDDYQYDDAEPKSVVEPATIFGPKVNLNNETSLSETYARWMTSPDNPRFTTVIANRLWKQVMGVGLIEPVDDLGDTVHASNPELIDYLTKLMIGMDFDVQKFLAILYRTETFQQRVNETEHLETGSNDFSGALLQRMSAEQIWDSFMTLIVQDLDERKSSAVINQRFLRAQELADKDVEEIIDMAKEQLERNQEAQTSRQEIQRLQRQLQVAQQNGNNQRVNNLRQQINQLRQRQNPRANPNARDRAADPRWQGFPANQIRASELPSPAPAGHFLQQFGQSDRETIDNAHRDSTSPQILTLLNGPEYQAITKTNSVLSKNLTNAKEDFQKLNIIFLSTLARYPTEEEKKLLLPEIQSGGIEACKDITWAILNSREFMFIQ